MRSAARRRLVAILAALAVLATLLLRDSPIGGASQDNLVYFGAWVGEQVNIPGDVDAFEAAVGKKLAIIHRYSTNPPYLNAERFDVEWATWVRGRGAIPMLSWHPNFGEGGVSLATVAAGAQDGYITSWADQIRDWGHPIFLRMMWEQNASWYEWRADSPSRNADFIAAWRHIVALFRSRGADNVTFVWSPNVSGVSAKPIMDSYPGDEYVDWVALDGYPYRNGQGDFLATFKPDYDLLTSRVDKPLMIAETSLESWSDQVKASAITDILTNQIPRNFPKVKALVWFDEKNTNGVNFSVMTAQGPLSRQAFRRGLASSYYASNSFGQLDSSPIPLPEVAILSAPPVTPTPVSSRAPISEFPQNLLANPGFEQSNASWLPQGWIISSYPECLSQDPTVAFSGSYSLRHESGSGQFYTVYQEVPVDAGQGYSFLGYVKVSSVTGYFNFNLQLLALNSSGGTIRTFPLASIRTLTNGWREVRVLNLAMPTGTARARLQMKVDSLKAAINVDDFVLVPAGVALPGGSGSGTPPTATATPTPTTVTTPTATPTSTPVSATASPTATATPIQTSGNLLANPSFRWSADGYEVPDRWSVSSWALSKVRVGSIAFDGDGRSLLMDSDGSSYLVFQEVPAVPGRRYLLTGWLSLPELQSGSYRIELVPLNRYGGTAGAPVVQGRTELFWGWRDFRLEVTVPSNASTLRVQFKAENMRGRAYSDALELVAAD